MTIPIPEYLLTLLPNKSPYVYLCSTKDHQLEVSHYNKLHRILVDITVAVTTGLIVPHRQLQSVFSQPHSEHPIILSNSFGCAHRSRPHILGDNDKKVKGGRFVLCRLPWLLLLPTCRARAGTRAFGSQIYINSNVNTKNAEILTRATQSDRWCQPYLAFRFDL